MILLKLNFSSCHKKKEKDIEEFEVRYFKNIKIKYYNKNVQVCFSMIMLVSFSVDTINLAYVNI